MVDQEVGASPGPQRDFVGYGPITPRFTWPHEASVAVNIVVNYEEGSEYSYADGDGRNEMLGEVSYPMLPGYRDLAVESTYEYGSRSGIWRLNRLFDEFEVKVTYFGCALAFERNPQVGEWMNRAGHDLLSHGWRWAEHWLLSRDEEREHIERAVASFEKNCGVRPQGWYCRYGPSVNTRKLVVEHGGFLYDSDAYNDDLPYFVQVGTVNHLVIPYSLTYNDIQGTRSPREFYDYCRRGLDELLREGRAGHPKMMSIGLHPRLAGQAGRTSALREFLEYATSIPDVWFARRNEIAEWWMTNVPADDGRA